jgi:proline racemase
VRLDTIITAVDAHAGAEPGRVIIGGVSDVPGATMLEKRDHLAHHGDRPRRHAQDATRGGAAFTWEEPPV